MARNRFTDPESPSEQWVDVRMHDPETGEWDVDAVVAAGQIEYLDLRIKPDLLPEFIECLVDDVGSTEADRILRQVAERNGLDLDDGRTVGRVSVAKFHANPTLHWTAAKT